jgi:predicted RNase H-like nuclease (RuvC/YqgF family)
LISTWIGVVISAAVTLYNVRANREKTIAETAKTKAETAVTSREAAAFDANRERLREEHWQEKLDKSEARFEAEIGELRDEVQMLRRFIERHVPWDWKAVRELRLLGSDIEDPPTLTYLKDGR